MQNKAVPAKTVRNLYNDICRDFPVGLERISKIAEAMLSLSSRVERHELAELSFPDISAWAAILCSKANPAVPSPPEKDLRDSSRFAARVVAHDMKGFAKTITDAAQRGNKRFFIELGKCLSGEITTEYYDRLDFAIAKIVCANPSIKAKDAVRELEKLRHPRISEENFRMRKKRLRLIEFSRKLSRAAESHKT
jgi:hypothetical protein